MSQIKSGAIDCDVHVEPPSMDALLGYIDPYWHEYIRSGHLGVRHRLYPDSEPMSARQEARGAAGGAAAASRRTPTKSCAHSCSTRTSRSP